MKNNDITIRIEDNNGTPLAVFRTNKITDRLRAACTDDPGVWSRIDPEAGCICGSFIVDTFEFEDESVNAKPLADLLDNPDGLGTIEPDQIWTLDTVHDHAAYLAELESCQNYRAERDGFI